MGRLFWKFLLAFWLALLTASLGVGSAGWLHQQALTQSGEELAGGPRAAFLVLQAAIGLARQRPERLDDTLDRIEREAVRLDQLVGELLTLSRMQAGMVRHSDEEIDLVELVREVAEDARFEAQPSGRQVGFVGEGEAPVIANDELLHHALENVVRNAVQFTEVGSAVEVQITRHSDPDWLVVTVSDRGPGVPAGDLEAIFEPFFRSETRAKTAGFGLGLAIARRAIEAHGGSIRARNRPHGGLQVEIVLPAVR